MAVDLASPRVRPARRWLSNSVRTGGKPLVGLLCAVFATLAAGRGFGEVAVNTLVWSRLPTEALPWVFIPPGGLLLLVFTAFGAALDSGDA